MKKLNLILASAFVLFVAAANAQAPKDKVQKDPKPVVVPKKEITSQPAPVNKVEPAAPVSTVEPIKSEPKPKAKPLVRRSMDQKATLKQAPVQKLNNK